MENRVQKLKTILKISGMTQQQLSHQLKVSFATLNSWVNERSRPRRRQLDKIDRLHESYQNETFDETIDAYKTYLKDSSQKNPKILNRILNDKNLLEEFALELTYNSNKIEGSTLSESETALVMFKNSVIPKKTFVELLEAKNHYIAFKFLLNKLKKSFKISEELILGLHQILMQGILDIPGVYRDHGVRILGSNIATANYLKIPILMKNLVDKINKNAKDPIRQIVQVHAEFEQIHPFSDGNGRIGRLMIQAMALKYNFAPSIIKATDRILYYRALHLAQTTANSKLLEQFIADSIFEGFSRLRQR